MSKLRANNARNRSGRRSLVNIKNPWRSIKELCCLLFFFGTCSAHIFSSAALSEAPIPDFGVIDQVVTVPFVPTAVVALVEIRQGLVETFPAAIVPYVERSGMITTGEQVFAAARIPLERLKRTEVFHFSFFIMGGGGAFAATPVKRWNKQMLAENSKTLELLQKEAETIERKLSVQQIEINNLEEKYKEVRTRGFALTGIDQIVETQTNLDRVKRARDEKAAEVVRLTELIEAGREISEPEGVVVRRQQLLDELKQAAQVTAMADRLNSRRREAAVAAVQRKVAAIRESKSIDANSLAKEILTLRVRRKALESKLNITGQEQSNEF